MLADLEPSELVEIRAAYRVVPFPDPWLQAGTIAASNHNDWERYMAAKAGKRSVDEGRLRSPEDYIPRLRPKKSAKIQVNQASIDAVQCMIEQQFCIR